MARHIRIVDIKIGDVVEHATAGVVQVSSVQADPLLGSRWRAVLGVRPGATTPAGFSAEQDSTVRLLRS